MSYERQKLKDHSQVDVILTDFCKAFDRIDRRIILLRFLRETGFGEPLLSWFRSFIEGKKQFVKIHGVSSEILPISSGVPKMASPVFYIFK